MGREGVLWGKHSDRTGLSSSESRGGIQESHDGQEGRQVSSVSMEPLVCALTVVLEVTRTSAGEKAQQEENLMELQTERQH